ncbi:isochorismatase family protein [Dissulfurirhabdus thermomarina]|uniref:Isochorismatase family protein n=1 Tax=Dissulfurirhabdus thermomarina TaxID=1765737 RepID=A0A6N9TKW4_DISTH|nr:isochorismatase family protein [Dissulfurirhabdus thermomarina]NDY41759.1 isochorismatase family protein [Dissulfurirhabdus thermomarina]NMX24030.1 isochorismatase family protein [Dissulfurirhabdus thermomarina]
MTAEAGGPRTGGGRAAPEACGLILVDPQARLLDVVSNGREVVQRMALLARAAAVLRVPALVTTQYARGLGGLDPALDALLAEVPRVDKVEFDALEAPGVQEVLGSWPRSVETLVLAGVEAHICVAQTALGALAAGYRVWMVADAAGSRDPAHAEWAFRRVAAAGGLVGPAEMLVYEWLGRAGTPAFKALHPHLV